MSSDLSLSGIPRLRGKENYANWRLVIDACVEAENSTKKSAVAHEAKTKQLIVTSVAEKILPSLTECATSAEMFEKLRILYGCGKGDLLQLHSQFHNFVYKNELSAQENITILENIKVRINALGDTISDAAIKSKVLNSLPKRFRGFVSACNLNRDLDYDKLIESLMLEDQQLTATFQKLRESTSSASSRHSTRNFSDKREKSNVSLLNALGSKPKNLSDSSKNVSSLNMSDSSGKDNSNTRDPSSDWVCFYCKNKGHGISRCPKLKDVTCHKCNTKGHIAKHCKHVAEQSSGSVACMGLTSLCATPKNVVLSKSSWILDNACNGHVCNDKALFEPDSLRSVDSNILVGNSAKVQIGLIGIVNAKTNNCDLRFENVSFNPDSPANLISVSRLLKKGWVVKEFSLTRIVLCKGLFQMIGVKDENDLWVVPIEPTRCLISDGKPVVKLNVSCLSLVEWHRCFAHQNMQYTREHLNRLGIQYTKVNVNKCVSCGLGKICRSSHGPSLSIAKEVGELTHIDLLISPEKSLGGSKYALVFKDDYSRYRTVYFLKGKNESANWFVDYFNRVETQTGKRPKRIRSDNGTEEINQVIDRLCSERGIIHETTCPFTPEQNGRAEREMRILSEAVTTILVETKSSKKLWAEAMAYAAFTLNRVGRSSDSRKTPYELYYNREPFDVRLLRPFGCKIIVQIPKEKRKKFDAHGEEGIFIGYPPDTKGYKVLLKDNKIRVSSDVLFLEFEVEQAAENNTDDTVVTEIDYDWDSDEEEPEPVCLFNLRTPKTIREIASMGDEEKLIWDSAVHRELESMAKYNVWTVVPYQGQELVDTKWVFRVKDTEEGPMGKARLVARGYQTSNYGDTYAPVANITSIRVFLSVAVFRKLKIWQVDVETAFLNGELKEEIFLKPPDSLDVSNGAVLKLNKALYGLKQAPHSWFVTIDKVLRDNGFRQSKSELCLYVKGKDLFLILYVDDILIAGSDDNSISTVIELLNSYFEIKVTTKPTKFLGLTLDVQKDRIEITQETYIQSCLQKFEMSDAKPAKTPMESKLDLSKINSNTSLCVLKFQKLLGSLNYVMERSRPDINFPVNALSRRTHVANEEHYRYLQRVLRYLKGTSSSKLVYKSKPDAAPLEAYCDASWAAEEDRKSTTGYLVTVYGNLVLFKSKKQSLVALSTAEAEFIAMSEAARDIMWIRNLLIDLEVPIRTSDLYCDNQACLQIVTNTGNYNRTRHVDIKHQHVRDLVRKNLIRVTHVGSELNLSDFLTKSLAFDKIKVAMNQLGFTGFNT